MSDVPSPGGREPSRSPSRSQVLPPRGWQLAAHPFRQKLPGTEQAVGLIELSGASFVQQAQQAQQVNESRARRGRTTFDIGFASHDNQALGQICANPHAMASAALSRGRRPASTCLGFEYEPAQPGTGNMRQIAPVGFRSGGASGAYTTSRPGPRLYASIFFPFFSLWCEYAYMTVLGGSAYVSGTLVLMVQKGNLDGCDADVHTINQSVRSYVSRYLLMSLFLQYVYETISI